MECPVKLPPSASGSIVSVGDGLFDNVLEERDLSILKHALSWPVDGGKTHILKGVAAADGVFVAVVRVKQQGQQLDEAARLGGVPLRANT
jgi:hypothetical protein